MKIVYKKCSNCDGKGGFLVDNNCESTAINYEWASCSICNGSCMIKTDYFIEDKGE